MNRYKNYRAKDFALDADFQKWVLDPGEQDTAFWNDLLEHYPEKRNEINEAIELVRLSGVSMDAGLNAEYLEIWGNVKNAADQEWKYKIGKFAKYASVAAAFIGILIVSFYYRGQQDGFVEHKTAYGEIKEVILEDGSTVMLNANSSITLSDSWASKQHREVFLKGEAFFNVVKTPDLKLFDVKTPDGITVQVLGTSFNVNTRREKLSVYLQSGKVRIQSESEAVTLQPGERADYDKSSEKVLVSQEDLKTVGDKLAWKSNLYILNDISLSTIARDIEDNFGKQVIFLDSALSSESVTAKLPARDINILLNVLKETLDVEIEQKDNQIIIKRFRVGD
jgi:transmembrane sensor